MPLIAPIAARVILSKAKDLGEILRRSSLLRMTFVVFSSDMILHSPIVVLSLKLPCFDSQLRLGGA
jgi:hypothetical protein